MRFRKRAYRGPGRQFFRRFRRPYSKARGSYELLLTDDPNSAGCLNTVQFANDSINDSALAINPMLAVVGQEIGPEGPLMPVAPGTPNDVQVVRVREWNGFSATIPLWDSALSTEYNHDAGLRSLRGYFLPAALLYQVASVPKSTGEVFKVRAELLPLEISELEAQVGNTARSSTFAVTSFSRSFQRRRIWWQREWLMPMNGVSNYEYYRAADTTGAAGLPPRSTPLEGGISFNLKNLMRIKRDRWPVLVISVAGNFDVSGMNTIANSDFRDLGSTAVLQVMFNARVRAYVTR